MRSGGDSAPARVHGSAIVDDGATVGEGTVVWHFCHVMSGARIGARCVLGQNVFVGGGVVVGEGCRIQNNVSLYDGVVLEDEVFVGPSVVFTNVRRPRAAFRSQRAAFATTRVGRGGTIGANATVVCGVNLGAFCFVAAGAVVTRDVAAHALVVGAPAIWAAWVCRCGANLVALDATDGAWICRNCDETYEEAASDDVAGAGRRLRQRMRV